MTVDVDLLRRVQQAAEGTPYVVEQTDKGFDVTLDIVNAEWFGVFNKAGLSKLVIHHVAFPEPGVYTITDDARSVEWLAGIPRISATWERQYGRVIEVGARTVWAFDEHGRFGVQADYRFSSEEGRDLIVGIADELGLQQRRGTAERIGLYFAIVALVGAALVVVLLLVLWLAVPGYFD